jgi:hypothetical protein
MLYQETTFIVMKISPYSENLMAGMYLSMIKTIRTLDYYNIVFKAKFSYLPHCGHGSSASLLSSLGCGKGRFLD